MILKGWNSNMLEGLSKFCKINSTKIVSVTFDEGGKGTLILTRSKRWENITDWLRKDAKLKIRVKWLILFEFFIFNRQLQNPIIKNSFQMNTSKISSCSALRKNPFSSYTSSIQITLALTKHTRWSSKEISICWRIGFLRKI